MNQQQIDSAVAYNEAQGYCDSEIKLIQRTVGATEDGVWGPQTVTKVSNWQATKALTPDGKVGPKTWGAIKSSWELVPTDPPPAGKVVQIGCGLAAYDNRFPGHTPEEAMDKDFAAALAMGCTELRYWSSEWLIDETLPNGGAKGNKYSGPWLASQTIPKGVIVGTWIDDPVRNATSEGFADRLVQMHIQRAAVMINRSNTRPHHVPWHLRYTREQLELLTEVYAARGIERVATCWPRPSKKQIDAMLADMSWVLQVLQTNTFEVDTEGNWHQDFLEGFSTMMQAAEYLAAGMRDLVGSDGELELTTFTYHRENSKHAQLAPLMDRLLPQGYSVRHRDHETVDWDDQLGPGNHPELAVKRARQAAAAM